MPWVLGLFMVLLGMVAGAAGQSAPTDAAPPVTLVLDTAAVPPPLGATNAAASLARTLKSEIEALDARVKAGDLNAQVQHAWRRVAFDLLYHGNGATEQSMAIAGFRLADARIAFDRLLERPLPDEAGGAAVKTALREFVEQCANGVHPVPDAATPELLLAPRLEALRRAVSLMETRAEPEPEDAWPTLWALQGAQQGLSTLPPEPPHQSLSAARAALANLTWISNAEREALDAVINGPAQSDPRLAANLKRTLECAAVLTKGDQPWDATRLRAGLLALAQQPTAAGAETLAKVLEAAQEVRQFELARVSASLRGAAKEVQAEAKRSAMRLAPMLPQLATATHVAADPALGSAVDAQTGAAADLRRLVAAGAWPDRLNAMRAGSRDSFERIVKNWATALTQPQQRVAARSNMDAFATQLALFVPMRLESRLRAGDDAAIDASAGQSQALLVEIDRRRDAWAAAWTRGSAGASLAGMLRAARTMEALAAVAAVEGRDPSQSLLSRWGGYSAASDGVAVHSAALTARAKLAVEALLAQDDAGVENQLSALERDVPVAWLTSQLADRLQPWLAPRIGVLAQLDALCSGPHADSWLGGVRSELMLFSRYAREEAAARQADDKQLAESLRAYLAAVARVIAPSLGGSPISMPVAPAINQGTTARPVRSR